jgi:hypothetical protein
MHAESSAAGGPGMRFSGDGASRSTTGNRLRFLINTKRCRTFIGATANGSCAGMPEPPAQ